MNNEELHDFESKLKQLQLQKIEEEIDQIKIEKEKTRQELESNKLKSSTSWYKPENAVRIFIQVFLGLGILGFYMKFILIPIFERDSIVNELELARKEKELHQNEIIFDSLKTSVFEYSKILEKKEIELLNSKTKVDSLEKLQVEKISVLQNENDLLRKSNNILKKNQKVTKEVISLEKDIRILQDSLKRINVQKEKLEVDILKKENKIISDDKELTEKEKRFIVDETRKMLSAYYEMMGIIVDNDFTKEIDSIVKKRLGRYFSADAKVKVIKGNETLHFTLNEYIEYFSSSQGDTYSGLILADVIYKNTEIAKKPESDDRYEVVGNSIGNFLGGNIKDAKVRSYSIYMKEIVVVAKLVPISKTERKIQLEINSIVFN